MADALLDVAVGGDAPDRVVEQALARRRRRGRTGRARGGPPSPCRPRCRRPGRAGRWWSRRRRCARARGGPGSASPRCRSALRSSSSGRSRTGRAGCTGSGWSARRRGRTGRGRASSGRSGRAAGTAGTAGRPPAPGSSPCRGGRCRPSAPRPWPAPDGVDRPPVEVGPLELRRCSRRSGSFARLVTRAGRQGHCVASLPAAVGHRGRRADSSRDCPGGPHATVRPMPCRSVHVDPTSRPTRLPVTAVDSRRAAAAPVGRGARVAAPRQAVARRTSP